MAEFLYLIGLGDDQPPEIKKPRRIAAFDVGLAAKRVHYLACGGMHTIALTNNGEVWTWGCNDDSALGRDG